jgi:hypothetical protein
MTLGDEVRLMKNALIQKLTKSKKLIAGLIG